MLILLHKERTENEIMQPLQSLLTALANKYEEELQINEDMKDLAIFLLCFCTPLTAYAILKKIYEELLPEDWMV
jgi:hypothetical protein